MSGCGCVMGALLHVLCSVGVGFVCLDGGVT